MLAFYLALYDIGMPTLYHWALVATEKGETLTSGPVQMFHIVTQKEGYLGEDGYMESHCSRTLLQDESSERLLCVLPLPDLKTTMSDLKQFMYLQSVGRKNYSPDDVKPLRGHPRRWGCSQWALRAIKALIEADMVVTRAKNSFFTETAANRDFLGTDAARCRLEMRTRFHRRSQHGGKTRWNSDDELCAQRDCLVIKGMKRFKSRQ
ncbi:hypothetical protein BKA70DRAFT_402103 [Coprinopsis sp. MPI-PUGE-AT-0042]|nr:hypothetical protein BKA70DRAFT_402103 [Coprinopsis sp. MPI-PUGE-AT-0042]